MPRFLPKLTLAACALFTLASTALAGINTWTSVGPEGGDITDLVITNTTPAVTYALTPKALYRSNDTGRTWAQVGAMFRQADQLAVHPTQPNRVFVIADGNLLASSDGGATRVQLTSPAAPNSIQSIEFSRDGELLYAADGRILYRSSDFGATWTAGGVSGISAFYIDPSNANRVIAVPGQTGMAITTDNGDHWTSIATPPQSAVLDVAFSSSGPRIWVATPEGLWYTSDDGANWTLSSLTSPTRVVSAVAVDPIDPAIVYAQVHSSIYRSTDGGAHWTRGDGTYGLWNVNAFAFDPRVRERLLIATLNGVWASADAGAHWSRSHSGIVATTTSRFTKTNNRTYFVVRGEIHYLDGGASASGFIDPAGWSQTLPFDPQEFLYALHADRVQAADRLFVSGGSGLVRSLDSGQSWVALSDPLVNNTGIHVVDVSPDNNVVLVGTSNGIVRSIDGGDRWSTTSGLPPDTLIEILTFTSANVAYAASALHVYRTTDAGLTWSQVDLPLGTEFVLSVLAHGNTTYLGTTANGYRSTDGGVSWTRLPLTHGGWFAADSSGVYLGGNGVSRSIDGGNTWTAIGAPNFLDGTGLQLDPTTSGRLLNATWYGGVHSYTVATDLAVTAAGQPSVPPAGGARTEISFTVTNRGPHPSSGATLDINVAGGRVLFENTDCKVTPPVRSAARCTLGPIPSGQWKVVRIESSFDTAGPLSITGAVGTNETDLTFENNTISDSWTYNAPTSSSGGSGDGGGGVLSWWMLLAGAGIAAERRRVVCQSR